MLGLNPPSAIIRVFPRRTKWTPTDDWAFVGDPPLWILGSDGACKNTPVVVSCAFTWDIPEAIRLVRSWGRYFVDVDWGGPARNDAGGDFMAGRFLKEGVTITSRGCPKQCPWCVVWRREGDIRTLPIVPGRIVQDNNLLACPRRHIEAVFDMLRVQRRVVFSGGLDATLFADWHRDLLDTIRLDEAWFAADTRASLQALGRAARICQGLSIEKLRCYVMIGFGNESLYEAEGRLEQVYELGFLPFAQLYRGEQAMAYPTPWRALARKWSRPAAYRATSKEALHGDHDRHPVV